MEQSSLETILKGLGACGIETHFDRGSCAFPQATVCYQIPPEKKGGRDNIRGIDPGFEHLKGQGGFGGPQMFWISVLVIGLGVFLVIAHKYLDSKCKKSELLNFGTQQQRLLGRCLSKPYACRNQMVHWTRKRQADIGYNH